MKHISHNIYNIEYRINHPSPVSLSLLASAGHAAPGSAHAVQAAARTGPAVVCPAPLIGYTCPAHRSPGPRLPVVPPHPLIIPVTPARLTAPAAAHLPRTPVLPHGPPFVPPWPPIVPTCLPRIKVTQSSSAFCSILYFSFQHSFFFALFCPKAV